jgi:hypothetical protein
MQDTEATSNLDMGGVLTIFSLLSLFRLGIFSVQSVDGMASLWLAELDAQTSPVDLMPDAVMEQWIYMMAFLAHPRLSNNVRVLNHDHDRDPVITSCSTSLRNLWLFFPSATQCLHISPSLFLLPPPLTCQYYLRNWRPILSVLLLTSTPFLFQPRSEYLLYMYQLQGSRLQLPPTGSSNE